MAAAGAGVALAIWVQICFLSPSILQPATERRSRSSCGCGKSARPSYAGEQICIYATAHQVGPVVTKKGSNEAREKVKNSGFFSPFNKLKYRFYGWTPVDRVVAEINLDLVNLLAGDPQPHLPRMIQAHLNDVLTLFFRWSTEDDLEWPLQREVTKAALFREHHRYARQFLHEASLAEQNSGECVPTSAISVQTHRQVSAAKARLQKWFFDGNTFVNRNREITKSEYLTEDDIDFMRGLPLDVVRIARGVFAPKMPITVARLAEELKARNITTTNQLLEKTNFVDFFALFDLFDEMFTQVDVLREFHRNWLNEGVAGLPQQVLPGIQCTGAHNLTALAVNSKTSVAEFPKCATLKCFMRLKWDATQTRFITVKKTDVNSLNLLLVGNSGEGDTFKVHGSSWREKLKTFFGFDELQQTVAALKDWHARESADAVLGLGSILGIPSATSVRSEQFDEKWYNPFVKDAGLNVPWLMTVGEHEGVLSPATPIRYHYTLQQPNWHMPNDMYTVVFQFQADLKLENGAVQRDAFNVTVVNLNTWALLAGNPITSNLQMQLNRMTWISRQLFAATRRNSTWVIVMGHHPIISTGVEGKQARLQYLEDVYSARHFRGWEHFVMHHLLFHYHVDAYISGHDYLMEYNTMEDVVKNTTISFINSGATARLMDRTIGRGWIGRMRGALYPLLCFTGRKIFFLADPGGCAPSDSERGQAFGWFAPKFGNFKVNIVERAMRATGFTSLQLTKDFMIVEFIDGRTKKPATRRVQRRSNKALRDVTFADPVELGRKKYAEVLQKREKFVRANIDVLRKEIYVAKRCPTLAERVRIYTQEINDMAARYDKIRQEIEAFQKMTETELQEVAARGLDLDVEIDKANLEMRAVAKYHRRLKEKYADLLALKDTLPPSDDPRYKTLLQHEKVMMTLRRKRLDIVRQQGDGASLGSAGQHAIIDKKIEALAATIDDLEKAIKTSPTSESKPETTQQASSLVPKPSKKLLVDRLHKTENDLRRLEKTLIGERRTDVRLSTERASKLQDQLETRLKDIRAQLSTYVEPLDPVFVWEKQQELHTATAKLKFLADYRARISKASQTSPDTGESDSTASQRIQEELEKLQGRVQMLKQMLKFRQMTPLQIQYLKKKTALALAEFVQTQEAYLSEEEKDVQRVKRSLHLAAEAEKRLRAEVNKLEQEVKKELQQAVAEWKQRKESMIEEVQVQGTTEQAEQGRGDTNNRSDGVTEPQTAESVGFPSAPTKAVEHSLPGTHSARGTEGALSHAGEKYSTAFRRAVTEARSKSPLQDSHHVRSAAQSTSARRLSVAKPVGASGKEARIPQEEVTTLTRSTQISTEKAADTEGQSRTRSEDHDQPEERSAEPVKCVEPCERSSQTAMKKSPDSSAIEAGEKTKDTHPRTAEHGAAKAAEAMSPTVEARNRDQEGEGDRDKAKEHEVKRATEKRGAASRGKWLDDNQLQSVSKFSNTENEELQDQLEKIGTGPVDECQWTPLLDVVVRRALHPEENAETDTKCVSVFADRALSSQLKTFTLSQLLSKGWQGLGAGVHPVPSVHVSRGWRLYFQDTPKIMFKGLMKNLKAGLWFVEETFKRSKEEIALSQKLHEKSVQATEKPTAKETEESLRGVQLESQRPASRSSEALEAPTIPSSAKQHPKSNSIIKVNPD